MAPRYYGQGYGKVTKAQARYKKNYDANLQKTFELNHVDYYTYIRVQRKILNNHHHKLAPITEGPHKVTKFNNNIVFIEKTERQVEEVLSSGVILAPEPKTEKQVEENLKATAID